ncbi:DUF899 family protein [Aurantimonas sp. 22II-16-19i]|uniref:DUF899 family protein n=1 Tax=Aurantimonas sp. 22II-16-19i TaxID=1317114 RepID=UPI0009F7E635|nr:DUF899 family protein [Aurantimonas sp. 22II-16-19i]ORE97718.1 hypothetical protein ATO4_07260 [Aurantimonas sp. 22II-16-19i]
MQDAELKPAGELARLAPVHFPNESSAYRKARTELLAEEIELRRHIARVAAQRRALPPGGEVTTDYRFVGIDGEVGLADLFGPHDTLVLYSFMYGPARENLCPMCSATMSSWDGEVPHIAQRVGFAMVARSPIERLSRLAEARGWRHLKLYSDPSGDYTADYVGERDADMPAYNVFSRRSGTIRHFWAPEGGMEVADPGQDPHMAPDLNPLWIILDTTPGGRGTDWYPSLRY